MSKILIVDDEPTIRMLFRCVFEEAGYAVALAKDGLEGLEALNKELPNLILLDVAMPRMSGRDFILEVQRLSQARPGLSSVPVLVMTGENFMDEDLARVFSSSPGFVCFIPKMTDPEIVLEKCRTILERR